MYAVRYLVIFMIACGGSSPKLPIAELQDPATCMQCHPQHYTEWSGSMHAYASDDPVFLAMNKRGQRDTQNQLGTFCVQCHAPMAVAMKLTDGTDFDPTQLPPAARGITCYFCHNVKKVIDDHNNGLQLALDDTMRGGVHDPVSSPAHNSAYDKMMDGYTNNSVECGSCHDVVTPRGVALERSYTEWQASVFASDDPAHHLPLTCSGCHMQSEGDVIVDNPNLVPKTRPGSLHLHMWPAIDQATTTFPQMTEQQMGVQTILDQALTISGPKPAVGPAVGGICVTPIGGGQISVRMDTVGVGHMYPSGAAQDRRVWLELFAYDASNNVLFKTGDVPDNMDPEEINDPNLAGFWDRTFQDSGAPAHFFWDVATEDTTHLLKPSVTIDPTSPLYDHSTTKTFTAPFYNNIDHITARIRTLPVDHATLDLLVQSGDLDPAIASKFHPLDAQTSTRTWTKAAAAAAMPFTGCCPAGQLSC